RIPRPRPAPQAINQLRTILVRADPDLRESLARSYVILESRISVLSRENETGDCGPFWLHASSPASDQAGVSAIGWNDWTTASAWSANRSGYTELAIRG